MVLLGRVKSLTRVYLLRVRLPQPGSLPSSRTAPGRDEATASGTEVRQKVVLGDANKKSDLDLNGKHFAINIFSGWKSFVSA